MKEKIVGGSWLGPALIGFAAFLWATDALFRVPTVQQLDSSVIVFFEHSIALAILIPLYFMRNPGGTAFCMRPAEWLAAVFIGAAGSASATVLFTSSFRFINPSVTILLQKLQPVMVIAFAHFALGERLKPLFLAWAALALAAGVVLSFPDFNFEFGVVRTRGALFAVGAAVLWAFSTVAGKILLRRTAFHTATLWRYVFGWIALAVILASTRTSVPWAVLGERDAGQALLYMSLIPGLLSLLAYYAGLARTKASVTTLVELVFPVSAVVLNTLFLDAPLNPVQLGAGGVLLIAVTMISRSAK